jgi:aconitate decarboxylase
MTLEPTGSQALNYTKQLSTWVASTNLNDIPEEVRTRAKYLILDGFACGLVGAHLPWSEKACNAIIDLESAGDADVIGWDRKTGPMSAALLNSSFIQGFELDDWHSEAPLHSNSILLPALLAAAQHVGIKDEKPISGADFLLATIVGYEVGPRVGLGLWGTHILTTGWHSGAVFGPPAAAAAVGRLLNLNADQIEDAFGIACTQACGLMSAQFGSEVKRMQHGFAARNGLLAAFLAKGGYIGIKKVFEQEYGGFLKQFSAGNGKTPQYLPEEIAKELGTKWQTHGIRVKPYSSMAGTHPTVDCVRGLQEQYPEKMKNNLGDVKKITITLGEAAFHHGGWKATKPLTSTGAQMSNSYIAATQMIHGQVQPAQFRHECLEDKDVWRLVDVTNCIETKEANAPASRQTVNIEFTDGSTIQHTVGAARGVAPALSNEEIVEKWKLLTRDVIDSKRADDIKTLIISLEQYEDISLLPKLLKGTTNNLIA